MIIENLNVAYANRVIYSNFSVSFEDSSVTFILGPSGCGKTTLLNAIAYNKSYTVSYIFQEPRLLPWYTIEKNLMLVIKGSSILKKQKAREYLAKVGLEDRAGEYPLNLSGGERQRVSIARAFSSTNQILLMDEPFQSQDPASKNQLISLVKKLQDKEKRTIIAVTHDVRDVLALADRAIVITGRPVSILLDMKRSENFELKITESLRCAQISI